MKQFLIFAGLALAGCDRGQPPAPSAAQSGQLNEAANLLNDMGDEKGTAPTGTAPSTNQH